MKKKLLLGALSCMCLVGLFACTSKPADPTPTPEPTPDPAPEVVTKAALIDSLVVSKKANNVYGGYDALSTIVNFYENNIYEKIETKMIYGYSMNMGTTVAISYGTYSAGKAEDGATPYTLNKAARVVLDTYSKAGGFHISIDSEQSNYPVELPATGQGEKTFANNKQDVLNAYGAGAVYYGLDGKNELLLEDPNGEAEAGEVTTASGDISKLFISKVASTHCYSEFVKGNYGDGSWVGKAYEVITFEDGTYEYISSEINYGYSMVLGTTAITNYGEFKETAKEDGWATVKLNKATSTAMNSYSKAGGYTIDLNTNNKISFPAEMLAKNQGEKIFANSNDDIINEYGAEKTVYLSLDNNELTFTNPND